MSTAVSNCDNALILWLLKRRADPDMEQALTLSEFDNFGHLAGPSMRQVPFDGHVTVNTDGSVRQATIVRKSRRKDAQYESIVEQEVHEDPRKGRTGGVTEYGKRMIGFLARLKRLRRDQ